MCGAWFEAALEGRRLILRAGRDDDAAGFIALVGACWAEYPGAGLDVDGENPELRALASYFAEADGALWVHEQDGAVAGMIGTKPLRAGRAIHVSGEAASDDRTPDDGLWELCKVYTRPGLRGTGLAQTLLATAETYAAVQGAAAMCLWSDTKFDRAHRFYEKHGYLRAGPIRIVEDKSNTLEFRYEKPLVGLAVRSLDVAAAGSAVPGLAALAGGGEAARGQVRAVVESVAVGESVLLAGWVDGVLAGSVQLDFAGRDHAGALRGLCVVEDLRRRGLGLLLLRCAEEAALAAGRRLLTAEVAEGEAAEMLLLVKGWMIAGRIPHPLAAPDDGSQAATILYRIL